MENNVHNLSISNKILNNPLEAEKIFNGRK